MHALINRLRTSSAKPRDFESAKKESPQTNRPSDVDPCDGALHGEEDILSDDQDVDTGGIAGTLAIADDTLVKTPTEFSKEFVYEVPCEGACMPHNNVTFEVISAEVVRDGRSGHVNYTVLINTHREPNKHRQTVVVRRYTDFEVLHHHLKKKFPSLLSGVSFPRKILTGNFTSQTIAKRSTAFEQYLSHLFSFFEVRYCKEFMEFFISDNFATAARHFIARDFNSAVPHFEKTLPVLEKLYGDFHPFVCQSLCALVVCYTTLSKPKVAYTCSEVAIRCCLTEGSSADSELQAALMLAVIRLCWTLGKAKTDLEDRLAGLKAEGSDLSSVRDLRDILSEAFSLVGGKLS